MPYSVGTWHDPDLGRPIAAPLQRCAELLGIDLATVRELAANVEPYLRADGTRIWSLTQLERQLRPEGSSLSEATLVMVHECSRPGVSDRIPVTGGDVVWGPAMDHTQLSPLTTVTSLNRQTSLRHRLWSLSRALNPTDPDWLLVELANRRWLDRRWCR
jgi:hypothetical protein